MKRLNELLEQIKKEPFSNVLSVAEMDYLDLLETLRENDRKAYNTYLYRYSEVRNSKLSK